MNEPWNISLLGGLSVRQESLVVERFRSQKFGALLAYLALHPERRHPREELADRFWPDSDAEAARASLRQALASLRRQLEPPPAPMGSVLEADRLYVRLNPDAVRVDVAAFEAATKAAKAGRDPLPNLETAVALYRGDLLPGFYDDWVIAERERLRFAFVEALERLAGLYASADRASQAIESARRLVAAEATREESQRLLIRLLLDSGRPADALRQYEDLKRLLRDQWDAEPEPETSELAREARARGGTSTPVAAVSVPAVGDRTAASTSPVAPPPPVPPTAATAITVRLPMRFTPFFGRGSEVAHVQDLVTGEEPTRLVTLTGIGGSGKTRLAIEVAQAMSSSFPGGVYFVALADTTEGARIDDLVLDALGVRRAADAPAPEQVTRALKERISQTGLILLVLDNAEHLPDEVADAAQRLLSAEEGVFVLATSRTRLELDGEREILVPPLPVPEYPGTPERLLEFPSVALFVDRAKRAQADFALTSRNASAVAALCEKLEGIPLAIELAAARALVMTPTQMLDQVGERYDFLVSRRRDLPERHRSLRAAVAWSVGLLSGGARAFLARLSVFRGGFTLEAAQAVCADPGRSEAAVIELLTDLRAASLVLAEPGAEPDTMRYRLLETIREYGEQLLSEAERADYRRRHAVWCFDYAHALLPLSRSKEAATWLRRMTAELPNLRAAVEWSLTEHTDPNLAHRLLRVVSYYFQARNLFTEIRAYLARAIALPVSDTSPPGLPYELPAITRARTLDDAGGYATVQGDYEAAGTLLEEARSLAEAYDEPRVLLTSLNGLGLLAEMLGDFATAQQRYRASLAIGETHPPKETTAAWLRLHLGICASALGDAGEAARLYEESLAIRRRVGDPRGTSVALSHLGRLEADAPALRSRAAVRYREALQILAEMEDRHSMSSLLLYIADLGIDVSVEHAPTAARLVGAVDAVFEATGTGLSSIGNANQEKRLALLRDLLSGERLESLRREGAGLAFDRVVEEATGLLILVGPSDDAPAAAFSAAGAERAGSLVSGTRRPA